MKKLIFIGAGGFIGKSFLDAFSRGLLNRFKIKKLYLITKNINKLKSLNYNLKGVKLIKGDISRINNLPNSDYIIYGAEYAILKNKKNYNKVINHSKKSIDNFFNLVKSNKKAKILYISSGAVYRYKKNLLKKNKQLLDQKTAYAYIKKYSEKKISELSSFKVKNSIARCFTFIGLWLPRKSKYAIGNFLDSVIEKKSIKINKKNKVIRSYLYADDMVNWLIKICIYSKTRTEIFDVGSDQSIELEKLARLFSNLYKRKVIFKKDKYNFSKVDKYLPNILQTKKKLKLKINYKLKESILTTIKRINEQAY